MGVAGALLGGAASGAVGGLLGGLGKKKNNQRTADFSLANNPYFNIFHDDRRGQWNSLGANATGVLGDLQAGLFGNAAAFTDMGMNNEAADQANTLGMDFLGGLQQYDPYQVAQMQYDLMYPILQDQEQQDRLDLESRLFAQGQLGSTPGSLRQNALYDAQEDMRRKLLADAFGQGLQSQAQQYNMGTGLLQLDPALRAAFSGMGLNALQGGLGIQTMANNIYSVLAAGEGSNPAQQGGINFGQALGAGLVNSGVKQITGGLDGLFNPTSPGYGQANWASP